MEETSHRFSDGFTECTSIILCYQTVFLLHQQLVRIVWAMLLRGPTTLPLREPGRTMFHSRMGGMAYLLKTEFFLLLDPMAHFVVERDPLS